jgi:beta-lactamase superfamily II metal-dependent hydrolase
MSEVNSSSSGAKAVKVRMYDVDFGDCFLITFPGSDGCDHHMLIDCGTIAGDEESKKMMSRVVTDIALYTGNHIDVLVLTHEHADHMTGFYYCRDIFKKIAVDRIWLAWTEDSTDEVAKELREERESGLKVLKAAEAKLQGFNRASVTLVSNLLSFELPGEMSLAQKEQIIDVVKSLSKNPIKPGDYLKPGQAPLKIPGVDGARVFILGPPRNKTEIEVLDKRSETYLRVRDVTERSSFMSAVERLESDKDIDVASENKPFDNAYEIPLKEMGEDPYRGFFEEHYGLGGDSEKVPTWRRIDSDWLDAAGQLALNLGDATNNTSLVLAIELTSTEPHKVLLFTGDAQIGSWLSWFDNSWPGEGKDGGRLTVEDLINRVVLLKVGHHGSRNATLKRKGLEKMTCNDLVAMIPVDEEISKKRFKGAHPSIKLLNALLVKTSGRVLRSDDIPRDPKAIPPPPGYDHRSWGQYTEKIRVHPDGLWVEYSI